MSDLLCQGFLIGHTYSSDPCLFSFDVVQTVKADFSNYDDNSAWPYLLDEFVDHVKEQRAMS